MRLLLPGERLERTFRGLRLFATAETSTYLELTGFEVVDELAAVEWLKDQIGVIDSGEWVERED
jgi:hypothetical protein